MFGFVFWEDAQLLCAEGRLAGPGGCRRTRQEALKKLTQSVSL